MRTQLLRGAVAIVAVTMLLFALPLVVVVRGQAVDAGLDALAARVEQAATLVDERSRTCAEVQVTVAALAGGPVEVAVFDRDGTLRFAPGSSSPDDVLPPGAEVTVAAEGATGREIRGDRLVVAVPLSTAVCGERLVLRGVIPDTSVRATARSSTVLLLLGALVALGLGAGAALVAGRRFARPLEALAASAERLGDGDFTERAPRAGFPEPDAIAVALDSTADRLGRAVARGTAFAADASHQLRTPLTALRLHLETLPVDDPRVAEGVEAALLEADRLESTVAELVALTSVDEADGPVDVGALVRDRAAAWSVRARAVERAVDVEVVPTSPRRVRPAAVAQALEVLVENALDHGRGTVRVVVQPGLPDAGDDLVRILVEDDGPGPDAASLAPLRQRDRGVDVDVPLHGGRGLPLARALVEGEGGRLVAEQHGERTVLVILLPVADAPAGGVSPAS